jgi:hypothetical protein
MVRSFLLLALVAGLAGRGTLAVGTISEHAAAGHPVLAAERTPEEAIAEIQNMGGTFTRDDNSPSKPVVSVLLLGAQVTDARLEHLKGLAHLRRLYLSATKVTDSGLEQCA